MTVVNIDFFEGRVRSYDSKYSVLDILKVIGYVNPRCTLKNYLKQYPSNFSMHQFRGHGQRETPVIPVTEVNTFINRIMVGRRLPIEEKRRWINNNVEGPTFVRGYVECEYINNIRKATRCYNSVKNHYVGPYCIDLVYLDYQIFVECDENNHKYYDQNKERMRSTYIESRTKCTWIRFDPYSETFCIFDVIGKIVEAISKIT